MRKLVVLLIACALFLGTTQATESVKPVSAVAILVCGKPVGAIVAFSDGTMEFVNIAQIEENPGVLKLIASLDDVNRHNLNVTAKGACPLTT